MTQTFGPGSELENARFADVSLRGARFIGVDFSEVVVRGSEVQSVEIDSPWIFDRNNTFLVNGVDVLPYVDAELNRRFPGRELQRAKDPAGMRAAWAALEAAWAATIKRAESMPAGTLDESVDGEWTFTETLRHLVLATDLWLGKAVLGIEQPFHPLGLAGGDGLDKSLFVTAKPSYEDVLAARADRNAMVTSYLATATAEDLAVPRKNPHDPDYEVTTQHCLFTIIEEGWEHHRYAVRDLDIIASRSDAG